MSLGCRRNTYLWRQPLNNSPTVSNRSYDISSAADNTIFKIRAHNIECSFICVAFSAVLLKLNIANILLFNFCEQKFVQHSPLTVMASPCLFSRKNGPIMPLDQNPHQTVTRNVCVRVFCVPNMAIFLLYISAKIKMT